MRKFLSMLSIATVADFVATYVCLKFLAGWETIPYCRILLEKLGWPGLVAFRLIVIALLTAMYLKKKTQKLAMSATTIYFVIAIIYSIFIASSYAWVQYKVWHP